MRTQIITVATLVILGLISGCSDTTPSTPISGTVADGYLVNATVFLDKNLNYQLDSGEPSATTNENGAYTLNVDPADVGKFPIVVLATKGQTIDKDTGLAVSNSFVLSMPAKAVSNTVGGNFISPVSSQIRELMETGKYSLQQAVDQIRTQMGLPVETPVLADFIANNNAAMHTAAQNMTSLMGSQMSQVLGTNGTSTTIDVNRYRAMMGAIFANLSSVKRANAETGMSNLTNSLTTILGNIPSGQPFRNMSSSFRGEHKLTYQILASSLHFPDNAGTGVHVFRSANEWSSFWNGQIPVLPAVDFTKNSLVAVINVDTSLVGLVQVGGGGYANWKQLISSQEFQITGLHASATGLIIKGIQIDGPGMMSTDPTFVPTGSTESFVGLVFTAPLFVGDATLNITDVLFMP